MDKTFRIAKILMFTYQRRGDIFYLPEKTIPYMDLTYCLEGKMEYYFEDELFILGPGDAILYPPGSVRQRKKNDADASYASFNIMIPEGAEFPVKGCIRHCVRLDTIQIFEMFEKEFSSFSGYKEEKCEALISYLYHQILETVLDTEHPGVKGAKQYIISHLSEPINLEKIAKSVHLAPNYLCSLFKKNTGMTIMDYITSQRIDLAKRHIVTYDLPLYRIAENCGFADYNYFSHTFKKVTGITAVQYRKLKLRNY